MMAVKTRSEIDQADRWNVEALYENLEAWQEDFQKLAGSPENELRWPELAAFKGRLGEGPEVLKEVVEVSLSLMRRLEKLYVYAHLRHDEDTAGDAAKKAYQQASLLFHQFSQEAAWLQPEILGLPKETLDAYMEADTLADFRFHLEKIVRLKKHTLSPEQEHMLALAGKALSTSKHAFGAINNSDLEFGTATDSEGKECPLSHAYYSLYMQSQDRTLRESAFKSFHKSYRGLENTLAELLGGIAHTHVFQARARGYSSSLESALYQNNIDTQVYHSLIAAVRKNISVLHKALGVRKRLLGVDELHLYDMYVPVVKDVPAELSYVEAEDVVIASVAPLGEDYQNTLREGLKQQRWVDRYENKNKRSGAYSSGCYDSMPYVLMNYKGLLRDVFTLSHECGHSMHSLLSRTNQDYHYADYTIFVAEVASTFNEALLHKHMYERAETKDMQIYLLASYIDDIRATLFRQTMFAEFELKIHEWAEQGVPLTPDFLKQEYYALNKFYFGEDVVVDEDIQIEWSRIPHFYYNFYVYQYATGVSAALTLSQKVLNGGEAERDAYLGFLKGGSSRYSLDLLESAGVNMRSSQPVEAALQYLDGLREKLEALIS